MDIFQRDSWRRAILLARATAPYLTAAKLRNLLRCEGEALRRQPRPRAYPYVAILDVAGLCNLHCPYCPTGAGRDPGRHRRLLPMSLVRKLLAEAGDYLLSASLYNWGEPLLHSQLPEMVSLFHQRRVFTSVSTNLSLARQDLLAALCEAGLDHLVVSLSGASQAVYEKYHRGGKLDLVLDNLQFLTDLKHRRGLAKPLIEVKYLVFTSNRHELPAAAHLAQALGVDLFRRYPGGGPPEAEVHEYGSDFHPFGGLHHCHQLWHAVVVNADGGVTPCCYTYFRADDLGDFSRASLREIRLNDGFIRARSLFNPRRLGDLPPDLEHPCLKCHLVHEQRHLARYLARNPYAVRGHRTGAF
jgi:MoaA/NifB/PqqE/SkfB family radical SAM enzyme